MLGQLGRHVQKNEVRGTSRHTHKLSQHGSKNRHVGAKPIKLSEENTETLVRLHDLGFDNEF